MRSKTELSLAGSESAKTTRRTTAGFSAKVHIFEGIDPRLYRFGIEEDA